MVEQAVERERERDRDRSLVQMWCMIERWQKTNLNILCPSASIHMYVWMYKAIRQFSCLESLEYYIFLIDVMNTGYARVHTHTNTHTCTLTQGKLVSSIHLIICQLMVCLSIKCRFDQVSGTIRIIILICPTTHHQEVFCAALTGLLIFHKFSDFLSLSVTCSYAHTKSWIVSNDSSTFLLED